MDSNQSQLALPCLRDEFQLPTDRHYLNCARMSPMSRRVEEAGLEGLLRKRNPEVITVDLFFQESQELRSVFSTLIQAPDANSIAIIPAASYGLATAARNLSPKPDQHIVLLHEQFPSDVYTWRRLAEDTGCDLITVKPPEDPTVRATQWNQRLLEAIGPKTAAVVAPTFHWSDGTRFDLEAISRRCREVGAALIVDGTQSVGAVPFDVSKIQPDALVCASYKTLHGPYSLGLAYYGERFSHGRPIEENWITRKNSEDFAGLVEYQDEYQPGNIRYDVGERSNFILVPMLLAALKQIQEWRPERIEAYCQNLTRDFFPKVADLGYTLGEGSGTHLFGLRTPAGIPAPAVGQALERKGVSVSIRGDAVRVSPNVYNDERDIQALYSALEEAAASPAPNKAASGAGS